MLRWSLLNTSPKKETIWLSRTALRTHISARGRILSSLSSKVSTISEKISNDYIPHLVLKQVVDDASINEDEEQRKNICCTACTISKDMLNWFKVLWQLDDNKL